MIEELIAPYTIEGTAGYCIRDLLRCGCWQDNACALTEKEALCPHWFKCMNGEEPLHYFKKMPEKTFLED